MLVYSSSSCIFCSLSSPSCCSGIEKLCLRHPAALVELNDHQSVRWELRIETSSLNLWKVVGWYGGFLKFGYPKMDGCKGNPNLKWMIWGSPYVRKPPYAPKRNVDISRVQYLSPPRTRQAARFHCQRGNFWPATLRWWGEEQIPRPGGSTATGRLIQFWPLRVVINSCNFYHLNEVIIAL